MAVLAMLEQDRIYATCPGRRATLETWTVTLVVLSMLAGACAPRPFHGQTPAHYSTAANCLQVNRDNLYTTGPYTTRKLTVATDDPALPPWWEGGTTAEHPEWERNDPYLDEGYEGAVTFEVARRFDFSEDQVAFVPVDVDTALAPGPKDFDFALQQIEYTPERTEGVDLGESYYDVNQALLSVKGSAIADATSIQELREATLGAPTGTPSLRYIEDTIEPAAPPVVADDIKAAVRDLENGKVDGIVVDLPDAFSIARQIPEGEIVGQFPATGSQRYFAMAFEKESPLVQCVDLALREMKDDGTLEEIRQEWLVDRADAPMIEG